ncbi:hypothetical protein PR048_019676, partial [Dryococelus australis]
MLNVVGINTQVIYSGNGFDVTNCTTFLHQLAKGRVTEEMTGHSAEKQNLPVTLRHSISQQITKMINQNNKRKTYEPCSEDKQCKIPNIVALLVENILCSGHVIMFVRQLSQMIWKRT